MSMNLHARCSTGTIDLMQTPTHITYMCTMCHDGFSYGLTGEDAVRALRCYLEWAQYTLSNEGQRDSYKWMREEIETVLTDPRLEVYVL